MTKIYKYLKLFSLIGVIILIGSYVYVRNIWSDFITEKEFNNLVLEIKKAPELPENFYYFYDKQNPNSLKWSSNKLLFNKLISDDLRFNSPSIIIGFYFIKKFKRGYRFKEFQTSLSWKLEKEVSQKECLNWISKQIDFLYNQTGIENGAIFYFEEKLNNLNDKELATLVLMMKNPNLYNPKRRKQLIEKELVKLLN